MEKKYVKVEQPIDIISVDDIDDDIEKDTVDTNSRKTSIVWDMDLWLSLVDCKRIYKLKISDYVNYKMRKVMEEEYPNILKRNKDFFSGI